MNKKKKIFISWSGCLSKSVADLLKRWIPKVLQDVEPFFSAEDIRKGWRSVEVILENMKDSKFAITCLTMSNKEKPWIEYEAGFLSGLNIPVAGLLINIGVDDLKLPLSNFQHALPDKEDIKRLLNSIREACNSFIDQNQFEENFAREWSCFEKLFHDIISNESNNIEEQRHTDLVSEARVIEIINRVLENKLSDHTPTKVLTKEEYDELQRKDLIDNNILYLIVE